ncbi:HAD family hydrolase [Kitasatospora sp. RB6PN24]|uniref:HAD family hydrolase n=1 Tax=Kitasatospora humi TaxID=2893891 RepID=UPI001E33B465|nr:HAD family hydrolase [Kitasatospora humi]MCC9308284.1 HAD family hydrolase [Kitasatospora humi]
MPSSRAESSIPVTPVGPATAQTSPLPPIAAISFDADDTLWDFGASFAVAIAATAGRLRAEGLCRPGGPVTGEWLAELWTVASAAAEPGATLEAIRKASFTMALEECGQPARPERVAEMFTTYNETRWAAMKPFPEVVAVLGALAEHYPLAVTTNGNTDPAKVGLDHFSCVTSANESGYQKPDPRMFHRTAERLGVDPAHVLHVGDHLAHDALAARAAGLQACWLNRLGPGAESRAAAAAGIREIADLTALLQLR